MFFVWTGGGIVGHNGCWGVMLLRNGSDEEGVPMYGYGRTVEELSWATEVRRKRCPNALLELATLYGLEDAVLESGIVANFTLQPSLAPVPAEGDASLYIRLDLIAGCRDENEFLYHAPTLDLGEAPILFVSTDSDGVMPATIWVRLRVISQAEFQSLAQRSLEPSIDGLPGRQTLLTQWGVPNDGPVATGEMPTVPLPGPSQHMRGDFAT